MTKGSATEVASIGPITITYAFRSWVLVDASGQGVQRRVRSEDQLADLLRGLGVPAAEAPTVAARLWAARPADARLAKVSPWEGFVPLTGFSRIQLFLAAAALVALAALILWLIYS